MKLLLDTSAIIEWERDNQKVVSYVRQAEDISISSLCTYETLIGLKKDKRSKMLKFFEAFPLISFDGQDSFIASDIYEALSKKGKIVNSRDILVAAQAKRRNLTVLTGDRDYTAIKEAFGLNIIKIEDLK